MTVGDAKQSGHWLKRGTLVDSRTSVTDVKFAPKHLGLQLVNNVFSLIFSNVSFDYMCYFISEYVWNYTQFYMFSTLNEYKTFAHSFFLGNLFSKWRCANIRSTGYYESQSVVAAARNSCQTQLFLCLMESVKVCWIILSVLSKYPSLNIYISFPLKLVNHFLW